MTVLRARNLSRGQVHELLGFQPLLDGSFSAFLDLEPLTEDEVREIAKIRDEYIAYWTGEKISEGQVRFLSLAPILRLAGYNAAPIRLNVEEDIAKITIVDQDTQITGRLDVVAVDRSRASENRTALWILVVESKNSEASESNGVAQMLTYSYESLKHQESVWGLVTNGLTYQFFHIRQGTPSTYQFMPVLSLFDRNDAGEILQVLKSVIQS